MKILWSIDGIHWELNPGTTVKIGVKMPHVKKKSIKTENGSVPFVRPSLVGAYYLQLPTHVTYFKNDLSSVWHAFFSWGKQKKVLWEGSTNGKDPRKLMLKTTSHFVKHEITSSTKLAWLEMSKSSWSVKYQGELKQLSESWSTMQINHKSNELAVNTWIFGSFLFRREWRLSAERWEWVWWLKGVIGAVN